MRQILIKSTFALALGIAPGLALAQTEMPRKKLPEQSEGHGGGQYGNEKGQGDEGGRYMEENGGENGERRPMKQEDQEIKRPKSQSEQERNEQGGEREQPSRKGMEEHGGGTKERHAERRHVSEEQRTELRRVFHEHRVEPIPHVNFSVDVGTRVPREIHLHRLPARILEIVPDYEGYMYFMLADGRIAIVDPDTLEIVLIIA